MSLFVHLNYSNAQSLQSSKLDVRSTLYSMITKPLPNPPPPRDSQPQPQATVSNNPPMGGRAAAHSQPGPQATQVTAQLAQATACPSPKPLSPTTLPWEAGLLHTASQVLRPPRPLTQCPGQQPAQPHQPARPLPQMAQSTASPSPKPLSPTALPWEARLLHTASQALRPPRSLPHWPRQLPAPAPSHCLQQPSHVRQGCCTQPARPSGHPGRCPNGPGSSLSNPTSQPGPQATQAASPNDPVNSLPLSQATVSNNPPMGGKAATHSRPGPQATQTAAPNGLGCLAKSSFSPKKVDFRGCTRQFRHFISNHRCVNSANKTGNNHGHLFCKEL